MELLPVMLKYSVITLIYAVLAFGVVAICRQFLVFVNEPKATLSSMAVFGVMGIGGFTLIVASLCVAFLQM